MSGKIASSGAPTSSNDARRWLKISRSSVSSMHGTRIITAIVRGSWRSWVSTRRAVARIRARAHRRRSSISRTNASSMSSVPVRCTSSAGRQLREQRAVAEQDQLVAVARLVEHVARDEQRRALGRELAEQRPQLPAQQRVEPDRRLVEQQQPRRRSARPRARRAHAVRPRGRGRAGRPCRSSPTRSITIADLGTADRREVAHVLAHGQVLVDRGCLGHVPEPRRTRRASPGVHAEYGDPPAYLCLNAGDRADERRLAAPTRSEQTRDGSLAERRGHVPHHLASPAADRHPLELDGRRH